MGAFFLGARRDYVEALNYALDGLPVIFREPYCLIANSRKAFGMSHEVDRTYEKGLY